MSEDRIPLAGVMGSPIAHSLSPRLHGHWLSRLGLRGHYVPLEVAAEDFETALAVLPKLGFVGANVTIPHKERALRLADKVSDRATLIGAANTLVFRGGGEIFADNTDGYGFLEHLRQTVPDWTAEGGEAMVLGAGGAARAVVASLLEAGVPGIRLANRTRARAERLASDFGGRVEVIDWLAAGDVLGEAALIVNTTSLGMAGKPPMRLPLEKLTPGAIAYDLVYVPLETDFLAAARQRGLRTVDGLGMLIHQAVPAFERFFGVRPEVTPETRAAILA